MVKKNEARVSNKAPKKEMKRTLKRSATCKSMNTDVHPKQGVITDVLRGVEHTDSSDRPIQANSKNITRFDENSTHSKRLHMFRNLLVALRVRSLRH